MTSFLVEVSDRRRVFSARIRSELLTLGGSWTYRLAEEPAGRARVTITEDGEVYSPLFRFVSRFIMAHTRTMDTHLNALGARYDEMLVITTPE